MGFIKEIEITTLADLYKRYITTESKYVISDDDVQMMTYKKMFNLENINPIKMR